MSKTIYSNNLLSRSLDASAIDYDEVQFTEGMVGWHILLSSSNVSFWLRSSHSISSNLNSFLSKSCKTSISFILVCMLPFNISVKNPSTSFLICLLLLWISSDPSYSLSSLSLTLCYYWLGSYDDILLWSYSCELQL